MLTAGPKASKSREVDRRSDTMDFNNARNFQSALDRRIAFLTKLSGQLETYLQGKTEEKLRISLGRYYVRNNPKNKNGVLLPDRDRASLIAQADYARKTLKRAREELSLLLGVKNRYPNERAEDVYENLHPARQDLIIPICPTDDEFVEQWRSVTWEPRPVRDDEANYETDAGYVVHSKSELIMANRFIAKKLPHRYEFPMYLEGYGLVRPDFIVLNVRTRKEYIWEHCGMMDNADYVNRNMKKFRAYQKNGYFVGDDIIVTTESSTQEFDVNEVDQWIQRKLL